MPIRFGQCLETPPMLTLQMKQGPRWRCLSNEMALAIACGIWIVHQAHICHIYNNIAVTAKYL
jgi:hypothetical protein